MTRTSYPHRSVTLNEPLPSPFLRLLSNTFHVVTKKLPLVVEILSIMSGGTLWLVDRMNTPNKSINSISFLNSSLFIKERCLGKQTPSIPSKTDPCVLTRFYKSYMLNHYRLFVFLSSLYTTDRLPFYTPHRLGTYCVLILVTGGRWHFNFLDTYWKLRDGFNWRLSDDNWSSEWLSHSSINCV